MCVFLWSEIRHNLEICGSRNQEHQPERRESKDPSWACSRPREKPVQNGMRSPESVGTGDTISYDKLFERNRGNIGDKKC